MSRTSGRLAVAAAIAAVVVLGDRRPGIELHAQQNPQSQRPPVFRGESVLVTVDAYPQRDGRIVEGLTAADFQVLEDGKPQTIENLEFVRVEPSLSESVRRDPESMNEMYTLVANPHNRIFVVFLDQVHVTIAGAHASRQPLVDTLNRLIGTDDLFAVMTQNTDPRALTFGRKVQSIADRLAEYWDWGERYRIDLDPTDPMEQQLKDCFKSKIVTDNGQLRYLYELLIDRRREDRTLTALERVVDRLGAMREARTVAVVITEGWRLFTEDRQLADESRKEAAHIPVVGINGAGQIAIGDTGGVTDQGREKVCNDELIRLATLNDAQRHQDLIKRANHANVSFYPVNPSGLQTSDTSINQKSQPSQLEDATRLRKRLDGMRELADNTDGIAIVNTNDIGAGMKKIVDDVSAYYLLGYYSTNTAHDGRYRRIDVKMKPPNVNVRARRGYFAPGDKPAANAGTARPAGSELLAGLEDALGELAKLKSDTDLFIRGAIVGDKLQVVVEIPSSRSTTAPWSDGADVRVTATGPDSAAIPAATGHIEAYTRGALTSMPVASTMAAVRVTARVTTGRESLENVADIRRAATGLVGEAVLYRGRPTASSPLRPVADMEFLRTERVHVEWPLSGDIDQRSARLFGRTGQPLAVPITVTERESDGRRVVAADLNLAPLSGGQYVIELTVGQGATSERRLVAFRVVQ